MAICVPHGPVIASMARRRACVWHVCPLDCGRQRLHAARACMLPAVPTRFPRKRSLRVPCTTPLRPAYTEQLLFSACRRSCVPRAGLLPPAAALDHRAVDYATEPLLFDAELRQRMLAELAQLGAGVEEAFGGVPQVGGGTVRCFPSLLPELRRRVHGRSVAPANPVVAGFTCAPPFCRTSRVCAPPRAPGSWCSRARRCCTAAEPPQPGVAPLRLKQLRPNKMAAMGCCCGCRSARRRVRRACYTRLGLKHLKECDVHTTNCPRATFMCTCPLPELQARFVGASRPFQRCPAIFSAAVRFQCQHPALSWPPTIAAVHPRTLLCRSPLHICTCCMMQAQLL